MAEHAEEARLHLVNGVLGSRHRLILEDLKLLSNSSHVYVLTPSEEMRSLSLAIVRRRLGLRWVRNRHSPPFRPSTVTITSRSAGPPCIEIAVQFRIARVS